MMATFVFIDYTESQTCRNEKDFIARVWSNSQPIKDGFDNLDMLASWAPQN